MHVDWNEVIVKSNVIYCKEYRIIIILISYAVSQTKLNSHMVYIYSAFD